MSISSYCSHIICTLAKSYKETASSNIPLASDSRATSSMIFSVSWLNLSMAPGWKKNWPHRSKMAVNVNTTVLRVASTMTNYLSSLAHYFEKSLANYFE